MSAAKPSRRAVRALPRINDVADFYALLLAIETEASERYGELADQMATHNNPEVSGIFRQLAEIERCHARQILERFPATAPTPPVAPWSWLNAEASESAEMGAVHYLMMPYHALRLALANEERAERFFTRLARAATSAPVIALAESAAAEEREHVRLLKEWLAKHREPAPDWAEDPDPPVYSE